MRTAALSLILLGTLACAERPPAGPAVQRAILATIGDSASTIEGIAEFAGLLYVCDWKDGTIYRIDPRDPLPTAVGALPIPAGTAVLGMQMDALGNLYLAVPEPGTIYRIAADRLGAKNFDKLTDATVFATGAAGANAIAFDHGGGHLWITGGATGNLYHVGPNGGPVATAASGFAKVGTDTTIPVRGYVVNGVAVDSKGVIFTANTGTGEITSLVIGTGYLPRSIATFVRDDRLIGADGLYVDAMDNLWVTANFRNTLARISPDGVITIVASSTPSGVITDSTMVPAYPQVGAANALRFPAEMRKLGNTMYLANLNFPIGANTGQAVRGASVAAVTLP